MLDAAAADAADPLAHLRDRLDLAEDVVYLDGNSLGPLVRGVSDAVRRAVDEEWRVGLIRSWNDAGWVDLPARVAARLAPLLGADPADVAVTDSTSANLFKVLAALTADPAAGPPASARPVLLSEEGNFPTDLYVAGGVAELRGLTLETVPRDALVARIAAGDVALLLVTEVDYRNGHRHDVPALAAAAHAAGARVVVDLAHSTGALDVDLPGWGVDGAVGCTYKYCNGGPGSPGYLWLHPRHDVQTPLRGWFGHAAPFDFAPDYVAAPAAARFLDGTPPVLSMAALEAALDLFDGVDPAALAAKARDLTERFVALVDARCTPETLGGEPGVTVVSPRDPARRGAQVALRHEHAYPVMSALVSRGVIGDHRPPDLLRFGFAPAVVRHADVERAVDVLVEVLATRAWDTPEHHRRATVT
ncbi:MAG: kynureninase [Actinomycetes bacterium]